jgi:phosphatidate cytidylyltransferase
MSPRISPNKTFEGLVGGIAATFVAAFVMRWLLGLELAPVHVAALAAILAVTGPLGDLVESLFKRDSGVKDSSSLLPGHGGFLDRTDSLFYPSPFVLAYLLGAGLV